MMLKRVMAVFAVLAIASGAHAVGTGTVDKVSGWYPAGSNVVATATPGVNSTFGGWQGSTNGSTIAGSQITVPVTGPKTITALFSHIIHNITASAGANGSISPSGTVLVEQGANQSFTITPNANYHVADVTTNGVSVGAVTGFTFTNVQSPRTIAASFAIDQYTVIFSLGANGTRTGGGALTQLVNYAAAATVPTVQGNTGYTFTGWSSSAYTSVTSNMTISAQYSVANYTLVYLAGANGSISGTQTQTVSHGSSGSAVTAVANTGYHFVNWSDSSTANPRTDTNVTGSKTNTANFAINTYTVTVTSPYGTATPSGVTTSNWGTVVNASVAGSPVVNGTTQYMATAWIGTGSATSGTGTNTSFTITNDTTISWQWQTNYWINFGTTGN